MSPEQLRADKHLDARADLWSVGVILFRCITGHLPFPGEVLGTVMAGILVDPIPPVSLVALDLPPALDAFFARALARDRAQRFQSARELVDAFAQISGGAPMGATAAGPHLSPFAAPGIEPAPPGALPSVPLIDPARPGPGSRSPQPVGPLHPGVAVGAFTPGALTPAAPAGTLTTAGSMAADPQRARRVRAVWVAGIASVLLGAIGTVTAVRLMGHDGAQPAAAGEPPVPAKAAPTETAPALPPPVVAPAPPAEPAEQVLDLDTEFPQASASAREQTPPPADTSKPRTTKPTKPKGTTDGVKPSAPATSATGKPAWGF
jgi:serine/threonine-protein kinase